MIPLVARRELWPSLAGPTGATLCVHDHGLAWAIGRDRSPHGQFGTHLSRGAIYDIASRWNGREYRESTRSTERRVAERPLASRVADGRGRGHHGPRTTVTPGHASVELTRTSASEAEDPGEFVWQRWMMCQRRPLSCSSSPPWRLTVSC